MILKILAFIFLVSGVLLVYSAGFMVKKLNLDKNVKVDFENGMDADELNKFKYTKAVVNFKLFGMLVMLPGLVLLITSF